MNLWAAQNKKGFTIVELLIVIVVIAILAAITVAAYNGIQDRAKARARASDLGVYVKGLMLYAAEEGTYPGNRHTVCLDGTTSCWGGINATSSAEATAGLERYVNSFPSFKNTAFAYGTQSSPNGNVTGWYLVFQFMSPDCPAIGSTAYLNVTGVGPYSCRVGLPNPG